MSTEIITQAPIQTRPNTLEKQERMFPFLVAEILNRTTEYSTNKLQRRVDLWNTVGRKIDIAYKKEGTNLNRYEFNTQQINARYSMLCDLYGINTDNRSILRDDDHEYEKVIYLCISDLIKREVFTIEKDLFSQCTECQQIIALISVGVEACSSCGNNRFESVEKVGLFLGISDQLKKKIKTEVNISPIDEVKRFSSIVDNMPNRIQLSKHRDYGISLKDFGASGEFVFDPKMALAMAGIVMRELNIGNLNTSIQGPAALRNLIPYFLMFDDLSKTKFISIAFVPAFTPEDVKSRYKGFHFPFLPLLMLSETSLSDLQSEAFRNEHFKTIKRFEHAKQQALNSWESKYTNGGSDAIISKLDISFTGEIVDLLVQNKTRKAVLMLRSFIYEKVSDNYFTACREDGVLPDLEAIIEIDKIFHLLYG